MSEFDVIGGLLFADGPINKSKAKALPRAAAAYRIGERMVIRGGIGLFSYDYFFENINQAGFAQPTPVQVTHRRRSDVHRRDAQQPAAVRPADSAGRLGQRPDELARSGPRHALPAGT